MVRIQVFALKLENKTFKECFIKDVIQLYIYSLLWTVAVIK